MAGNAQADRAFGVANTNSGLETILGIENYNTEEIEVQYIVTNSSGELLLDSGGDSIHPNSKYDFLLDLPDNTIGLIQVRATGPFNGRTYYYSFGAENNIEFGCSVELADALAGGVTSTLGGNSIHPDPTIPGGTSVWTSLAAPFTDTTFLINRWDLGNNTQVPDYTALVDVPAYGVRDVQIITAPNTVSAIQITGDHHYFARNAVYSGEAFGSAGTPYCRTTRAGVGVAGTQYIPISNITTPGSYMRVYLELLASGGGDVHLQSYDQNGTPILDTTVTPGRVSHYDVTPQDPGTLATLHITSPDEAIAQAGFYYFNEDSSVLESAYVDPAREASAGTALNAPYNVYLNQFNYYRVSNLGSETITYTISTDHEMAETVAFTDTVPAFGRRDTLLDGLPGIDPDTYGPVKVEVPSDRAGEVFGELFRGSVNTDGRVYLDYSLVVPAIGAGGDGDDDTTPQFDVDESATVFTYTLGFGECPVDIHRYAISNTGTVSWTMDVGLDSTAVLLTDTTPISQTIPPNHAAYFTAKLIDCDTNVTVTDTIAYTLTSILTETAVVSNTGFITLTLAAGDPTPVAIFFPETGVTTHTPGLDGCPQDVEEHTGTNTGNTPFYITWGTDNYSLQLDTGHLSGHWIQPTENFTFTSQFNCADFPPQEGTVAITYTAVSSDSQIFTNEIYLPLIIRSGS